MLVSLTDFHNGRLGLINELHVETFLAGSRIVILRMWAINLRTVWLDIQVFLEIAHAVLKKGAYELTKVGETCRYYIGANKLRTCK